MPPCDDDASPGREGGTTPQESEAAPYPSNAQAHALPGRVVQRAVAPEAFIERALEVEPMAWPGFKEQLPSQRCAARSRGRFP